MVTEFNFEQSVNAYLPMAVTPFSIVTDFIEFLYDSQGELVDKRSEDE